MLGLSHSPHSSHRYQRSGLVRIARSITPYVAEIERADHRMFVPGELATSAAVLGQVMTAVERFLDQVVWP